MANKTLKIEIIRSVIIDAVKTDTHIKGTIDKSLDERASRAAYNETAGDEAYHERKIDRTITASAENLVAEISDMLSGNAEVQASFEDTEKIKISVGVDARFNTSFAPTLARLSSEYITNYVLVLWWGAITNGQNQVQFYTQLSNSYLNSIRKCFNKMAPAAPQIMDGEEKRDATILDTTGTFETKETEEQA
ncbi:MAG: hypothetical protein ACI3YT_10410 [Prevotella sp.]